MLAKVPRHCLKYRNRPVRAALSSPLVRTLGVIVKRELCDQYVGSLGLLPVPGQEPVERRSMMFSRRERNRSSAPECLCWRGFMNAPDPESIGAIESRPRAQGNPQNPIRQIASFQPQIHEILQIRLFQKVITSQQINALWVLHGELDILDRCCYPWNSLIEQP